MPWITVNRFPLTQDLSSLASAIRARQLPCRIIEEQGAQHLQLADPDRREELEALLQAWSQNELEVQSAPVMAPSGPGVGAQLRRFPVTGLLLLASLLGYALLAFSPLNAWVPWLTFYPLAMTTEGIQLLSLEQGMEAGQWWRLVTPAFLHFGIFHIIFNALWLWELGRRIEWVLKPWGYLFFTLVVAIVSNLSQHFWHGEPGIFGGMSGVVYALVGYIAIAQRFRPHPALMVPRGLLIFMLVWLLLCLSGIVDFFIAGGIANGAHVGGLVAGAAWALLQRLTVKQKEQ